MCIPLIYCLLQDTIQFALTSEAGILTRSYALQIARSLEQSLFFHEVDWDMSGPLRDDIVKVYCFERVDRSVTSNLLFDDPDEIPTGVLTRMTSCYSPFCQTLNEDGSTGACYSYTCPNKLHVCL